MADTTAVLAYWKEHREQLRQSEIQRSTVTNFLIVVVSGLSVIIVQQRFTLVTLPLGILITILGGYGFIASAKFYERAAYHLSQARALTHTLVGMGALGPEDHLEEARRTHNVAFGVLARLRLHHLWTLLHGIIVVYGLALFVIILVLA